MNITNRFYVFKITVFKEFFTKNTERFTQFEKEDFLFIEQDSKDTDYIVFQVDDSLSKFLPKEAGYEYYFDQVTERSGDGLMRYYTSSRIAEYYVTQVERNHSPEPPYNTDQVFANTERKLGIYTIGLRVLIFPRFAFTAFSFNNFKHVNIECTTDSIIRFSIPTPYVKPAIRGVIQNEHDTIQE